MGFKNERPDSHLLSFEKIFVEKNSAYFLWFRHRVTKSSSRYVKVTTISSSTRSFSENYFLSSNRPKCFLLVAEKKVLQSYNLFEEKQRRSIAPSNFWSFFRHRVTLGIRDGQVSDFLTQVKSQSFFENFKSSQVKSRPLFENFKSSQVKSRLLFENFRSSQVKSFFLQKISKSSQVKWLVTWLDLIQVKNGLDLPISDFILTTIHSINISTVLYLKIFNTF